jgi:pimeloyl-ACP methyl ester carboxylesterase
VTDYLLVHGAGQGAWAWGRVWGYLTAPEQHPPPLDRPRRVNQVYALDLPGHGANNGARASRVSVEECVQAVVQAVQKRGLRQLVLVGHSFAAPLLLQVAGQLAQPPKRLVLVSGIVPAHQDPMLKVFPCRTRTVFHALDALSRLTRQPLKLPRLAINRYVCNGMAPMEVAQVVGRFGPLPVRVLKTPLGLGEIKLPCPVTYVVLTQDRATPPQLQQRMAQRIPGVEVVELESCHQPMLHRPRELAQLLLRYA